MVVTVSDHKFLPIQPLDRFCRTTDAVVECRLKVGQRLKETHARDGDMGKFCSAVYDWFQVKYGMKCPSQCRKLQCKSTCMWLGAKKKLNKDDTLIKDDMLAAEDSLKRIKGMGQEIHEQLAIEKKMNFSIKMLNVKLDRAKNTLVGITKDQEAHKNKTDKVTAAYTKLENTIELTKQSLIKQADTIMKQKFAIDKAKLKLESMTRSIQRDTDRAKEDREEQKSLQAESDKLKGSIAELNLQKAGLAETVESDLKAGDAQGQAYQKRVDAMMKAAKELDVFKVNETGFVQEDDGPVPVHHDAVYGSKYEKEYGKYMSGHYKNDPSVPIIKELLDNQHKRVRAAEKILYAIQKKVREAEAEIKEIDADIKRLEAQKKEADDAATTAETKAKALEKKATDGNATATLFQANSVTKPEDVMQKAEDKEKKTHASKAKAERTLKHMGELLKEQQAKLAGANAAVSSANLAKKSVEDQITKSTDDLTTHQKKVSDSQKAEKDAKAQLGLSEKALVERIKVYKAAVKDLDKHKPEIVRQHGLQPEL